MRNNGHLITNERHRSSNQKKTFWLFNVANWIITMLTRQNINVYQCLSMFIHVYQCLSSRNVYKCANCSCIFHVPKSPCGGYLLGSAQWILRTATPLDLPGCRWDFGGCSSQVGVPSKGWVQRCNWCDFSIDKACVKNQGWVFFTVSCSIQLWQNRHVLKKTGHVWLLTLNFRSHVWQRHGWFPKGLWFYHVNIHR